MLILILVSFLFSAYLVLSSPYSSRPWDTSSYCNTPHVNASYYQAAEEGTELVHLTVLMRHHKRTPVALVPNERGINDGIDWDCSGVTYDGGGARLSHSVDTRPDHPFAQRIWSGSCEEGQITAGGFHDSNVHGKDIWELYHDRLRFLRSVDSSEISVRTTYVDRTKHVASGVLAGMSQSTTRHPWQTHAQPQRANSLAPSYKCHRANILHAAARASPFWQDTMKNNSALKERIDSVLGTAYSTAVWLNSFTFYQDVVIARVCNDHPLPCNATGDCISEEDAAQNFELSNFFYLLHRAENAAEYIQLTFGVMFSELADALQEPTHRLALYVAHDTSIVRIAAGLGIFPLRWPGFGSEFVFEIWSDKNGNKFVRVLHDGELINSLS